MLHDRPGERKCVELASALQIFDQNQYQYLFFYICSFIITFSLYLEAGPPRAPTGSASKLLSTAFEEEFLQISHYILHLRDIFANSNICQFYTLTGLEGNVVKPDLHELLLGQPQQFCPPHCKYPIIFCI